MRVVIRHATLEDRPAMKEIFNAEVQTSTASWEWFPLTDAEWHDWFVEHTRDHHVLLVAQVGEELAGFAGYGSFRSKAGYVTTVEDSIFLREQFRGQGVGRQLLDHLLAEARQRGIHSVIAAVTAENTASIRLHTTAGYREAGRLPQVGHKFGRWLDLTLLQLILDNNPVPTSPTGPLR